MVEPTETQLDRKSVFLCLEFTERSVSMLQNSAKTCRGTGHDADADGFFTQQEQPGDILRVAHHVLTLVRRQEP